LPDEKRAAEKDPELTIGTRSVPFKVQQVAISQLRYYEDNPRVYTLVESLGIRGDQAAIERELWNLPTTKELFQLIKANGGLLEEIIVSLNRVLEGNRRLCAYRKLQEIDPDPDGKERWSYIPAKVITSEISNEDIFILLGTLHIKGKVEWKPYEQAGFVYRMKHEFGKDNDQIAAMIGLKKHNIAQMLKAYELMKEKNVEDQEKYSYFLEYFKRPEFSKLRETTPEIDDEVANEIIAGRIPKAQDIRRLPAILGDKRARHEFLEQGEEFEKALGTAHQRHPEHIDTFYRAISDVRDRLKEASPVQVADDIQHDHNKRAKLDYFFKEVEHFKKVIGWDRRRE
jgi:hypothetical protein